MPALYVMTLALHAAIGVLCLCFGVKNFRASRPELYNLKKISLTVGGILLGIVLLRICGFFTKEPDLLDYRAVLVAVGLPIALAFYCVFKDELLFCPACSRLITPQEKAKELISSYTKYENVKRQEVVKNKHGETVFTVEKDEVVPVQVATHRHHYQCTICRHQWTKVKTT